MQSWCAENRTILGQRMQESTQKRNPGTHQCEMRATAENVLLGVTLEIAANQNGQDRSALAMDLTSPNVTGAATADATLALPARAFLGKLSDYLQAGTKKPQRIQ